jgi:hypothetical protein
VDHVEGIELLGKQPANHGDMVRSFDHRRSDYPITPLRAIENS